MTVAEGLTREEKIAKARELRAHGRAYVEIAGVSGPGFYLFFSAFVSGACGYEFASGACTSPWLAGLLGIMVVLTVFWLVISIREAR